MSYPHPAAFPDDQLLKQCEIGFGRTSGPGGQHRNKVETAVFIKHVPTGVEASASERRKQFENRVMALKRLRLKLAINIRNAVHPQRHKPSELWVSRRQGPQIVQQDCSLFVGIGIERDAPLLNQHAAEMFRCIEADA